MDVFCTVIDIISVCGSIALEIPILWPRAVMVGLKPRVLPTLPLHLLHEIWECHDIICQITRRQIPDGSIVLLSPRN